MKFLVAILLLIQFNCFGKDIIGDVLGKALRVQQIFDRDNSGRSSRQPLQLKMNDRGVLPLSTKKVTVKKTIPIISKIDFIPKNSIKKIIISPSAKHIAYVNKQKIVKIISVFQNDKADKIIQLPEEIKDFAFIGEHLLYSYEDEENNLNVILITENNNYSKQKRLNFVEGMKSVRILCQNSENCLIECFDGEKYSLYKINILKGNYVTVKEEQNHPTKALFDKKLNPILIAKTTDEDEEVTRVYFNPPKRKVRSVVSDEDSVDNEDDNTSTLQLLDEKPLNEDTSRYISVDDNYNCYKAEIRNNTLSISTKNLKTGKETIIYNLANVSGFSQCKINLNSDGVPEFVTINARRYQHKLWKQSVSKNINQLNNKFGSWYRMAAAANNRIWLICVVSDKEPDQFYLYDTSNGVAKIVYGPKVKCSGHEMQSTKYYITPSVSPYVQMFFTPAAVGVKNPAMIMLLNSHNNYSWKYVPLAQLLSNRGYNVMCVNCRSTDPEIFQSDILKAAAWAMKNGLCKGGDIVLCAKKKSSLAALNAFYANQRVFKGCILAQQNESQLARLNEVKIENALSKSLLVFGRFPNSEAAETLKENLDDTKASILSTNTAMDEKLIMGLIDNYLAKINNNSRKEVLSKKEIEKLDISMDNLGLVSKNEDSDEDEDDEESHFAGNDTYDSL